MTLIKVTCAYVVVLASLLPACRSKTAKVSPETARLPATSGSEDPDGEDWFKFVEQTAAKVITIDDFLALLPEELRKNHVFMFDSKSLQAASYQRPRAIVFSPRAHFVLTFNGDPSQRGYEVLETMRFTRQNGKRKFKFQELVFNGDLQERKSYLVKAGDIKALQELEDRADRTGPNAALCLSCHRSNPRPNWEHYPFWPGAYGQFDDKPFSVKEEEFDPQSERNVKASVINGQPAAEFPRFLEAAPGLPRYRHLLQVKRHMQLAIGDHTTHTEERTVGTPLATFTQLLALNNFERITDMLKESKPPTRNALQLLKAIKPCPETQSNSFYFTPYQNLKDRLSGTGVAWEDFFMNFYPLPTNSFNTPGSWPGELRAKLLEGMPRLRTFLEMTGDSIPRADFKSHVTCDNLE